MTNQENAREVFTMGKKIVCESCGTIFPFEKAKDMTECPVCGAAFDEEEPKQEKPLSFGEGVELGPYDSFDEDKIDFWWESIHEPGVYGETDNGYTNLICTQCKRVVGCTRYPIAKSGDYVLIDSKQNKTCKYCENIMKNHILLKRPEEWVASRRKTSAVNVSENTPKCPTCSSTNIRKLSATSKLVDVAVWGVLSRKAHKQWHCDNCGSEW